MNSWEKDISSRFSLSQGQITSLHTLLDILVYHSDRNLTAVTSPKGIVDIHFKDSLFLLSLPELKKAENIVDIGSGAGFPGLPLAIANPFLKITFIESNMRKSEFIANTVSSLELDNCTVLNERAEIAGKSDLRESFDIAFARAVGPLPTILEYSLPLLKIGGSAIFQRGAREDNDEEQANAAILLGGRLNRILPVKPFSEAKNLHIWIFDKTGATPAKYPRKPGIPKKRPLK